MGNSSSKHTQLTEILSNVMMSTMASQSTSASSGSSNTIDISIVGSDNVQFKDNAIKQLNSVDMSVLSQAATNASLQQQMTNNLVSEVTQQLSNFPQIGNTNTDIDIQNIIKNNVSVAFSSSSMASIDSTTTNTTKILIGASTGVDFSGNKMEQQNEAIMRLINTTANTIANELLQDTSSTVKSDQSTQSVVADIGDALVGVTGNVTDMVSSVFSGSMMLIMLIAVFVLFIMYKFSSGGIVGVKGVFTGIGNIASELIGI